MGIFGGGAKTVSTSAPRIGSMRVQTSAFGAAIPIIYGTTRTSVNLIWYGDFIATPHTTPTQSGGKGGGGGGYSNTTYTYAAAVAMAFGEGVISAVTNVWKDKEKTALSTLGLSLFTGTHLQAAWSHLTTNHPGKALTYPGISYVATASYDLGDSAEMNNHSFLVNGILDTAQSGGIHGALIETLLPDLLTNVYYGAGFPAANIGAYTGAGSIASYALASGLLLSPAYTEQRPANDMLTELALAVNGGLVWSEGLLKLIPYCDTIVIGNWATFTPGAAVQYSLNDDDFLTDGAASPIKVTRKTQADAYNKVTVEYIDSANDYNIAIVEATDQANIEQYGLRPMEPV